MQRPLLFLLLFSVIAAFTTCKKQQAFIPSYIRVPAYDFRINPGEGSSSQFISDVWVYVNDQTIGAFQIPANFPVLANGPQIVKIRGGVLVNGSQEQHVFYPFFDWYIDTLNLKENAINEIRPTFSYLPGTKMSLIEDFEPGDSATFARTSASDTIYNIVSGSSAMEGNSAEISLAGGKSLFEMKSVKSFNIPADRIAFLELNYRGNYPFTIGIYANDGSNTSQNSVLTIYPPGESDPAWNKIYVNLSTSLARYPNATTFNIFIGALRTSEATVEPRIYIDNIKLVGA